MDISRPSGTYNRSYAEELIIVRTRTQWAFLILGLVFLFTMPLYVGGFIVNIANYIGILIVAALGLHILMGYCGQMSIGQSAFMGVGAYLTAILIINAKVSFFIAMPIAALLTGLLGIIVGLPSLRVKGFYLVMATLAAQVIIPWIITHVWIEYTAGTATLDVPAISIGEYKFLSQRDLFYVIWPIVLLGTYFSVNLMRSKTGRTFIAIRDNDLAAELMGISLFRYKLLAFFICSVYAGVAGGLWAEWMRALSADQFNLHVSVLLLGMIIVGGAGSNAGVFMGVIFLVVIDEITKSLAPVLGGLVGLPQGTLAPALAPIVFGLVILLFLIYQPRGLAHQWQLFKTAYRLNPFSY